MQVDPIDSPDEGQGRRDYGWALYFGYAALLQIVVGAYIAVAFEWGWIIALGMCVIAVALLRHAREDLSRRRRDS